MKYFAAVLLIATTFFLTTSSCPSNQVPQRIKLNNVPQKHHPHDCTHHPHPGCTMREEQVHNGTAILDMVSKYKKTTTII